MGIALALLLAPWVSAKQCYFCNFPDTANYIDILMACEEDDYDMDRDEESNISPASTKGCLWPNYCEHERQPFTYLSVTYYTITMDCWAGELWEFESSDLEQYAGNTTFVSVTTGQIVIGLLWFLF